MYWPDMPYLCRLYDLEQTAWIQNNPLNICNRALMQKMQYFTGLCVMQIYDIEINGVLDSPHD